MQHQGARFGGCLQQASPVTGSLFFGRVVADKGDVALRLERMIE